MYSLCQIYFQSVNKYMDIKELPFLMLLNAAPTAVICADRAGKIIFWNTGAARIFGYSESEIIGLSLTTLMPEKDKKEHLRAFEAISNTITYHHDDIAVISSKVINNVAQLQGLRRDGTEFPCEISVVIYGLNGVIVFMGFVSDVSGLLTVNLIKSIIENYKNVENKEPTNNL
jgi:PAS domain S-box-containing protein